MLKLQSLDSPPTVSNYVLNKIRENILTGRYPAGSKLDQKALATELGVGLIPVREALRRLEAEGFILILPHRGAFVAELSIAELEEIYLIRENLEGLATRLAAPNLSSETLRELSTMIEDMESATAARDFGKLLILNRTFHFLIYDASERPLLSQMIGGSWDRSSRYRYIYTYLPERQIQALGEHKEIYGACLNGDAARARHAVQNNVRQTVEGIVSRLACGSTLGAGSRPRVQEPVLTGPAASIRRVFFRISTRVSASILPEELFSCSLLQIHHITLSLRMTSTFIRSHLSLNLAMETYWLAALTTAGWRIRTPGVWHSVVRVMAE